MLKKIIWLSDLHFLSEGTAQDLDPRVRLNAAIDYINLYYSDAKFCVISGDLVNEPAREHFQALAVHLDRLKIPYFPMMGNNDDRGQMRSSLKMPPDMMEDFIQYKIEHDVGTILCLDSHKPGSLAGELCDKRLDWLSHELSNADGKSITIFMHHPPAPLGLPMQDTICLENGKQFLELLELHNNVHHLFLGHVHRPTSGAITGIPYATLPSVLYQAPAPRPEWTWGTGSPAEEAPKLGVVLLDGATTIVQYQQFCPYETGLIR